MLLAPCAPGPTAPSSPLWDRIVLIKKSRYCECTGIVSNLLYHFVFECGLSGLKLPRWLACCKYLYQGGDEKASAIYAEEHMFWCPCWILFTVELKVNDSLCGRRWWTVCMNNIVWWFQLTLSNMPWITCTVICASRNAEHNTVALTINGRMPDWFRLMDLARDSVRGVPYMI